MTKVTLQINLAPSDYAHAKYLLQHQLEVLYKQVDEVLLIIDTNKSKGRFAKGWQENKENLNQFLANDIEPNYNVRILPTSYNKNDKKQIANYFFGSSSIPNKDFRGGPFYAYFYGLYHAKYDHVLHLDSDIFLGGGSQTWVKEALAMKTKNPKILILSPLPGPPHPEEKLIGQKSGFEKLDRYCYAFSGMSTRIFLVDKSIFKTFKLPLLKPNVRNQLKAIMERNPNAELPEHLIGSFMQKNNLIRVDFLGTGGGLWSIHPPFRNATFYHKLPLLLHAVETNQLPTTQYGFYDMVDEMCDWEENREILKKNRWWKRLLR